MLGKLIVSSIVALSTAGFAGAATVHSQPFDAFPTASGNVDGWYEFHGASNTIATIGVDANGTGGSQGLYLDINGAAEVGTNWYWYAGLGRSDIANAGDLVGTTSAADVTFAVDLSVTGNTSASPVTIELAQYSGSTATWTNKYVPTLVAGFNSFSYTLDGTGALTGAYDPTRNVSLVFTFNNGAFGLDAGNVVRVDNVTLTTATAAVPEPAALALAGVAGLLGMRRRGSDN